ncbi:hypothetical protein DAEQUDRAFT_730547 [Daedalea quercina L-15889]|uniref:Uncharacterized protein n=1 Tax=Daedalea quercina L-15889 TaxID=1314783 RepID=A0A165MW85_9APHY|nr:hypothetical protein DAEQUDRAFT_730547 [Daedalea quercina L-15889]
MSSSHSKAAPTILRSNAQASLTVDLAVRAASAAKQVDVVFDVAVTAALFVVDIISGHEPFAPQLLRIQATYHIYVWATYALSLAIADYGEKFDNVIIKLCADKSLSVEQRREAISGFIRDADTIHTTAIGIMTNLNTLEDDFNTFVASFRAWVTEAVESFVRDIQQALGQLSSDVARIRSAAAASLGLPVAFAADRAVANSNVTSELSQNDYVGDAVAAIDSLGKLWQAVTNDAEEIEGWLKDGADDADLPEYMKLSLEEAVKLYADMAVPLRAYANALTEKNIPLP